MVNPNSTIQELEGKIYGYWKERDRMHYYGTIGEAGVGSVDIIKDGVRQARYMYSIEKSNDQFVLKVSNFDFTLVSIDDKEMITFGPLPGGIQEIFTKLPDESNFSI